MVANKADLRHLRTVPRDEAENFSRLNDVSLIETSALDNSNVEYAFETLISQMYHDLQNTQNSPADKTQYQPNLPTQPSSCCFNLN